MSNTLTTIERSTSLRLGLIFALRMFGLFIVLPVLAPYAAQLPLTSAGAADAAAMSAAIGWALGAYGLTQAFLYIPYGILSDRFGRKPLIFLGLILFAAGSFWAASAASVWELAAARALQGTGAISAVVMAWLADATREEVRTRAMARIGVSIALTFAASLVLAPLLVGWVGMTGVFVLIGALAVLAMAVVASLPAPAQSLAPPMAQAMLGVLRDKAQWRLNLGVFVLHAIQMAMWVAIPAQLLGLGLSGSASSVLYLLVIVCAIASMVPLIVRGEKHGRMHEVMGWAIALIVVAQGLLMLQWTSVYPLAFALWLFFTGFNVLEASQPSLLSKRTNPATKGAASGVYNTVQALGLFSGAVVGAWLVHQGGSGLLYATTAGLAVVWWLGHYWGGRLDHTS